MTHPPFRSKSLSQVCSCFAFSWFVWASLAASGIAQNPFGTSEPYYFPGGSMGKVDDKTLTDISGMAVGRRSRNVLWIHQSGSTSEVIALNRDGTTAKTFELGIAGSDIQDVAIGPGTAEGVDYIYLGDIGGRRSAISVFRFPEPRIMTSAGVSDLVEIRLAYPDGPHSAQSLLVDPISGDLLIATKESHRSRIYRAAPAQLVADSPSELELLIEVSFPNASAGDISSDGLLIVLRNENEARMWKRDSSETVDAALRRSGSAVAVVGTPREPDGDAIAFVPDSATYLTVSRDKKEHIFTFNPNSSGFESGTMTGELPESDLGEISGMVASRYEEDVFWVHNDGPIDRMFAIDGKGKVLVTLMLDRTLTDVEDIAASTSSGDGRAFLYLGDIGDNDSIRPTIGVLGFPEPQIPAAAFRSPVTLNAQNSRWLPLSYPFRPSDAETLLFDGASGELLIATKEKSVSNLYRVPNTAPDSSETQVLEFVTDVPFSIASGGDVSQSGEEIVLRREDLAMLWTRTEGEPLAQALLKSGREIPVMTPPIESNGESFAFTQNADGYFTVGEKKKNAPVFYFGRRNLDEIVRISSIDRIDGEGVSLRCEGFPSVQATVERSEDLSTWEKSGSVVLDVEGNGIIDLPMSKGRFFRLRR